MAHGDVMMAAVVGIPDPECGEWVHAEIVLRGDASVELDALRDFLAQRLDANKMPKTMNITEAIPLSPVGKVLRRVVRDASRQKFAGE